MFINVLQTFSLNFWIKVFYRIPLCFLLSLLPSRDGIYTPPRCLSAFTLLPPVFRTSALSSPPPPPIILLLLQSSPLITHILSPGWPSPASPCPSLSSLSLYSSCPCASLAGVEVQVQDLEVPQGDKVARGEAEPRGVLASPLSTLQAYQLFRRSVPNWSAHSALLSSWWATLVK